MVPALSSLARIAALPFCRVAALKRCVSASARSVVTFAVLFSAGILCLPLAACSMQGGASDASGAAAATDDDARGAVEGTAMVIDLDGGQLLFIDQDNGTVYFPGLDEVEVIGLDGAAIDAEELVAGNIVRVTGNGIMLESYPGQYPGISRVEVIEEGSPADTDRYADIINQLRQPVDPSQPAMATLEYATDLARVSLAPLTCGYEWSYEEDGEQKTEIATVPDLSSFAVSDLPDARLDSAVEARLSFSEAWTDAAIVRAQESEGGEAPGTDAASDEVSGEVAASAQEVEFQEVDGQLVFNIEPGWRYRVTATFDAGTVTYAFTVLQPR